MKILAALLLLFLTACKTTHPVPGNELAEMILHKDFVEVARDHPEFVSYCVKTISRLELDRCVADFRKMEAIKERYKRIRVPAPVKVEMKPILVPPPLPPGTVVTP